MVAVGAAEAQKLVEQAAAKGYSADDVETLAKRVDGRDLQYVSRSSARRIARQIADWPRRETADAVQAVQSEAPSSEPMASVRQVDYLADLYRRFAGEPSAEQLQQWARLTRRQASQLVDEYRTTAG